MEILSSLRSRAEARPLPAQHRQQSGLALQLSETALDSWCFKIMLNIQMKLHRGECIYMKKLVALKTKK